MKRREAWGALASAFGARGAAKKTTPQRSASQKVTRSRCANRRHVETQEQIELFRWAEREKHRWTMRVPMPLGPVPSPEPSGKSRKACWRDRSSASMAR